VTSLDADSALGVPRIEATLGSWKRRGDVTEYGGAVLLLRRRAHGAGHGHEQHIGEALDL
jgi:hypothetical protein